MATNNNPAGNLHSAIPLPNNPPTLGAPSLNYRPPPHIAALPTTFSSSNGRPQQYYRPPPPMPPPSTTISNSNGHPQPNYRSQPHLAAPPTTINSSDGRPQHIYRPPPPPPPSSNTPPSVAAPPATASSSNAQPQPNYRPPPVPPIIAPSSNSPPSIAPPTMFSGQPQPNFRAPPPTPPAIAAGLKTPPTAPSPNSLPPMTAPLTTVSNSNGHPQPNYRPQPHLAAPPTKISSSDGRPQHVYRPPPPQPPSPNTPPSVAVPPATVSSSNAQPQPNYRPPPVPPIIAPSSNSPPSIAPPTTVSGQPQPNFRAPPPTPPAIAAGQNTPPTAPSPNSPPPMTAPLTTISNSNEHPQPNYRPQPHLAAPLTTISSSDARPQHIYRPPPPQPPSPNTPPSVVSPPATVTSSNVQPQPNYRPPPVPPIIAPSSNSAPSIAPPTTVSGQLQPNFRAPPAIAAGQKTPPTAPSPNSLPSIAAPPTLREATPPTFRAPPTFSSSSNWQPNHRPSPPNIAAGHPIPPTTPAAPCPPQLPRYPPPTFSSPPQIGAPAQSPIFPSRSKQSTLNSFPQTATSSQSTGSDRIESIDSSTDSSSSNPKPNRNPYMRCTLNQIPISGDILSKTGMPLALILQPLASSEDLPKVPLVPDVGESGPLRCNGCRAFLYPFWRLSDQSRRSITCKICGIPNVTPTLYLCNSEPDLRSELCNNTVEFNDKTAPQPMSPNIFFLVDVSTKAIESGVTAAACGAIREALTDILNLEHAKDVKLGFATYDNTVHFYKFREKGVPHMMIIPDIEDVHPPLQTGITVPIFDYLEQFEHLLESIPEYMFKGRSVPDSAMAAAVKAAAQVIKSTGGKLFVFQSVLPTVGYGALTLRDQSETDKICRPANKAMEELGAELAKSQICCNIFVTATEEYTDVASMSVIPSITGGQLYYYYPFSPKTGGPAKIEDSAKLSSDVKWNIIRPQSRAAVLRVRCSLGLKVLEYSGPSSQGVLPLPNVDCDKTVTVTLGYDDKIPDERSGSCCIQSAFGYTTTSGETRVRVTTLYFPVTTSYAAIFGGADADALVTYMMKTAAKEATSACGGGLSLAAEKLTRGCVDILHAYRQFCAPASAAGRLALPTALKRLPQYVLGASKSVGFCLDSKIRTDDRSYFLSRVSRVPASLAVPAVYPRMFAVHGSTISDAGSGPLPLSSEYLGTDGSGIFMIENGDDAFIYAGDAAPSDTLFELFGIRTVDEVDPNEFRLRKFDNEASRRFVGLVESIKKERSGDSRAGLRLRWCSKKLLYSLLVEDSSRGPSYLEFCSSLQTQILAKDESKLRGFM